MMKKHKMIKHINQEEFHSNKTMWNHLDRTREYLIYRMISSRLVS